MTGIIEYQGIICRDVTFVRSRGYGADECEVLMPAASFPKDFSWELPATLAGRADADPGQGLLQAQQRRGDTPQPLPAGIQAEGTLRIARILPDGTVRELVARNMFVQRIDSEIIAQAGANWINVSLVDERFFSQRGLCKRWIFNQTRFDGSIAKDTVKPDGNPLSQAEILRDEVAPYLFRGLEVANVPEKMERDKRELIFPPFVPATNALRHLVDDAQLEDPCLRLDGKLSLHEPGDGTVAWAQGGQGPNTEEFPPDVKLDLGGQGQGHTIEANYPEGYFLVVAEEPTVATVAIDDCEPVVMINGRPFLISEEFVRLVTAGKMGLDALREFAMMAPADQKVADIPEDVCTVFREQAFKFWRIRGVEKVGEGESDTPGPLPGDTVGPEEAFSAAAEASGLGVIGFIDSLAAQRGRNREFAGPGFYTGEAGPNAHLLPILDRAETQGGKRLPPIIETYRFTQRRSTLAGSDARRSAVALAAIALQRAQNAFRNEIVRRSSTGESLIKNPFLQDPVYAPEFRRFEGSFVEDEIGRTFKLKDFIDSADINFGKSNVELPELSAMYTQAKRMYLARQRFSSGAQLEQAYEAQLKAKDELNGTHSLKHYQLAKQLLQLELATLRTSTENLDPVAPSINNAFDETSRQIALADEQREQGTVTGVGRRPRELNIGSTLENLPRSEDPGSKLVSADLGVFETNNLAGHAENPDVAVPSQTRLNLCPVRAVFGAVLRPRIDVPPGVALTESQIKKGRQVARLLQSESADLQSVGRQAERVGECFGGQDVIPEILTEALGHFAQGFRRTGRGTVDSVPLDTLPFNLTTRMTLPRGARQLVTLNGDTNAGELFLQAEALATAASGTPDFTSGETIKLADPWPVQCDGVVAMVKVSTEFRDDVPAGFTTEIWVGSNPPPIRNANRTRPRKAGDAANQGINDARRRT